MKRKSLLALFLTLSICVLAVVIFLNSILNKEYFLEKLKRHYERQAMISNLYDNEPLLNITQFYYLLENSGCGTPIKTKPLLAIIIVSSNASRLKERVAHRQTLPQKKLRKMGFRRLFLLGAIPPTENGITQQQLMYEQHLNNDLLQGNFIDSPQNLTHKHIMGLRWAARNCKSATFIIKMNDDVVFDIYYLQRKMRTYPWTNDVEGIAGYVEGIKHGPLPNWQSSQNSRINRTKVMQNKSTYLRDDFYITNSMTATHLSFAAQYNNLPFIWSNKVWLTGIVRANLMIPPINLNIWFQFNASQLHDCVYNFPSHNKSCRFAVGAADNVDIKLFRKYFENLELENQAVIS